MISRQPPLRAWQQMVSRHALAAGCLVTLVLGGPLLDRYGPELRPMHAVVAVVLGAVAGFAVLGHRRNVGLIEALVLAGFGLHYLPRVVAMFDIRDRTGRAVGLSAYIGDWKSHEYAVHVGVLLVALAVPFGVAVFLRRSRPAGEAAAPEAPGAPTGEPPPVVSGPRRAWLLPLSALVPFGLYYVPDLLAALSAERTATYSELGFDDRNHLYWSYLVSKGAVPLRDFWYAYGFQYHFRHPLPVGALLQFASDLLLWSYVLVGTYVVLRRFVATALVPRFLLVAGTLLAAVAAQGNAGTRYLAALGVLLLFVGAHSATRFRDPVRVLFGVALLHVMLLEPLQLLYAAPGVAAFLVVDLVDSPTRRAFARRLGADALGSAVPVAIAVTWLARSGQLSPTLEFLGDLPVMATYTAIPSDLVRWLTHPSSFTSLVYLCCPLAVALGVSGIATSSRGRRHAHTAVLAVGILGWTMLQKQVVRPHIDEQTWLALVYGPLLWLAATVDFDRLPSRLAAGGLAGLLVVSLVLTDRLFTATDRMAGGVGRLASSAAALVTKQDEFREEAERRFDLSKPSNYTAFAGGYEALRREVRARLPDGKGRVWILGDDFLFNIVLGQSEPYYFHELFDTAPLDRQKQLIAQLERRPPQLVVWDSRKLVFFDGVPHAVRVPLLFGWAVEHFVPLSSLGTYEVLRPRAPGEPRAPAWWRERLGPVLDLGRIPGISRLPGECHGDDHCSSYLRVTFDEGQALPERVDVPVTVEDLPFTVRFSTSPGVRRYVLNLDHVWFWNAGGTNARRSVDVRTAAGGHVAVLVRDAGSAL